MERIEELRDKLSLNYGVWLQVPDSYILRPFNLQQHVEGFDLTHQQLELLGDSLLDVIVYDYLATKQASNVQSIRTQVTSNEYLGSLIANKDLSQYIVRTGFFREYKALANVFEALLGSLYLGLQSIGRSDAFQILEDWLFTYWDVQERLGRYIYLYRQR